MSARLLHAVPALALSAVAVLGACKSAHEKCVESRTAATAAWNAYIEPLEAQLKTAKETTKTAQSTLKGTVEPRMAEAANKIADQRYIPGTEGWLRGRAVVLDELCRKDEECSKLKHDLALADQTIKDAEERLGPARAARKALEGDASGAKTASDAVIIDPERPALKAAQAASNETQAACEGVKNAP